MKRYWILCSSLLLCISTGWLQAEVQPVLVFQDTFDTSRNDNDINFEMGGRQSGTAAPLSYSDTSVYEALTQVNNDAAPGWLWLQPDTIENQASVSPLYNFNHIGPFTVEFDVNPGFDDATHASGDWAAVIIGANGPNTFVNASNGIGILFRNNGQIQVFNRNVSAYGGDGGIDGGMPRDGFHVAIEVDLTDFLGQSPATVRMFIDGVQADINQDNGPELVLANGLTSNYITLMGYAEAGNTWTHLFDNLKITGIPCLEIGQTTAEVMRNETTSPISVTIPAGLNATEAAQVVITSSAPGVARPTGAGDDGILTLEFPAGGATTQTFTVDGVGPGSAVLNFSSPQGICVAQNLAVMVASGIPVQEMLFLDNYNTSEESWDINYEIDTNRQTGSVTPLEYTEAANTAAGGFDDLFTAVNSSLAPDELYVVESWVAPNHNFVEGNAFKIEFDVHPGFNIGYYEETDWAAVAFGASTPIGVLPPNQGIAVLFRNNLRYQVFAGPTMVFESPLEEPLPIPPFHVEFDVQASDFAGGGPTVVSMYVNDTQYPLTGSGAELIKADGIQGNYISLIGYGAFLDHSFDNLEITADACIRTGVSSLQFEPGITTYEMAVQIPAGSNQTQAIDVTLTCADPDVVTLAGATDGVLELTFAAGGPSTQMVTVQAVGKGITTIGLDTTSTLCFNPPIEVSVRTGLVLNPSFEIDPEPVAPGYGTISNWAGGNGINSGGPFSDNGIVPDRNQVAFIQNSGALTQNIVGLEPGQLYWLQFFYNIRNCCNAPTVDVAASFDGNELIYIPNVKPVGSESLYEFQNVEFSPGSDSGLLALQTVVTGDGTGLFDAVTIVKRSAEELVISNPSFEASGNPPAPGYVRPARLAGWVGTNNYGVNLSGAGPFADNGINPDQDMVAFLQNAGSSLSQTVYGLVLGEEYTLSFSANARLGNSPNLLVTLNGTTLLDEVLVPVETGPYTTYNIPFTATEPQVVLTFAQTAEGDHTALIDDVRIFGERSQLPCISVEPTKFDVAVGQTGNLVTVTVPEALTAVFNPVYVTVATSDMELLVPDGANDQGQLTLAFQAGGDLSQSFDVLPLQRGASQLTFSNPHGVCFVNTTVSFNATRNYLSNPSFQESGVPAWPGYGDIAGWGGTGNSGVNNDVPASSPFADNGIIPDRNQVAFIQTDNAIFQNIGGLIPGEQYWLQFAYNKRNGEFQSDLTVTYGDQTIIVLPDIQPVGGQNPYYQAAATFTPSADSGQLRFQNAVTGDATVLLDAVSITKRGPEQVMIINPSFEASGTPPFPGVIGPQLMAGWAGTGSYGVNLSGIGPFADNGLNPDQERVLIMQGIASVSQTIAGLTVGETYNLSYAYNARSNNSPTLQVTLNGAVVQQATVNPVGGENPYLVNHHTFVADQESVTLTFSQVAEGDNTILIDDVQIALGAGPIELILDIQKGTAAGSVVLSWPADGGQSKLQRADGPNGPWTDVTEPVVETGGVMSVTLQTGNAAAFFKLVQ